MLISQLKNDKCSEFVKMLDIYISKTFAKPSKFSWYVRSYKNHKYIKSQYNQILYHYNV